MSEVEKDWMNRPHSGSEDNGNTIRWISRSSLPARSSKADFNVWSFVKHCFGKDLTKISMPVVLNEPLSFLQRIAEYMEYSELLMEACKQSDSVNRMEYVCAFAVSATSSNHDRVGKPFNPLLGETYELHHNEFVLVAEQVSHHPPIAAVHVQSEDYCLWSTVQFKLRFWGKSLEVQPKGVVNLKLLKHHETYTWQHPNLVVHNLLMGKLWLEHVGEMVVTNHDSGLRCHLDFQQLNSTNQQANQVIGRLVDQNGHVLRHVFGNWARGLFSVDPQVWINRPACFARRRSSNSLAIRQKESSIEWPCTENGIIRTTNSSVSENTQLPQLGFDFTLTNQKCLWSAIPRPQHAEDYYSFTQFAVGLNELSRELSEACVHHPNRSEPSSFLPPTDCRFRPDIRALELGQLDEAANEKERLEEKQRRFLKQPSRGTDTTSPLKSIAKIAQEFGKSTLTDTNDLQPGPIWFKCSVNPITNQEEWIFTGDYWLRDWSKSPNLY